MKRVFFLKPGYRYFKNGFELHAAIGEKIIKSLSMEQRLQLEKAFGVLYNVEFEDGDRGEVAAGSVGYRDIN